MPHGPDPNARAKGGNPPSADTFENQILSLVPSLRRYSRSLAKSDSDGEDLLQDCVEKVLVRRGQWRGVNLRAWAFTIMTNLYRDRHRRIVQHPSVELDDTLGLTAEDVSGDPLEKTRLHNALNALSADHRSVLMLVVIEGYGYQDVADMLVIPIGTVMSRLSRARRQMAAHLAENNIVTLRRPK
ncbi:RNA polymerase sigma factor [Pararhizobium sp. YC-54]|uniref:RNA polymerase sigma factor n=1 Tax=Pararhizobium sp. YC-54 TaxID=2986920 RepID=UPI0021F797CE|nr:RNA polymerase sigma factor [Pararhizobium sp. YC-54]MCW0001956.1 RNA polymerase sigma factor [Pararhizobium sp. YC-54]